MRKSSASGRRTEWEEREAQSVNGFHRDGGSLSTIRSKEPGPNHGFTSATSTRSEAFSSIVYASRAMDEIIDKIERVRDSSSPTLITGETGTGKELIARAVHASSSRHAREFIPFNCGDVGPELIASELFGHRRGAFTGADKDSKGVIREADGGTLFLDEIGELPLAAQPKLLRFLQEGEIRPLGDAKPVRVNVRVIAATNRDLEAEVRAGRFRADLLERLNKLRLRIPPLRERREDIPPLIKHFLSGCAKENGKQELRLSAEAWAELLGYAWPRNIRELENVIYRLVVFARSYEEIGRNRVQEEIGICAPPPTVAMVMDKIMIDRRLPYHERQNELARLSIIEALTETNGNLSRAAVRLGMSLPGLRKSIKRLGIEPHKSCH